MTVFADTYDTVSPSGDDNPTEGDDRIRETKAAIQERENVDHYWPLTGTEVSDADTGEHRKVTLRVGSAPSAVADKGFVYAKDVSGKAELFYIDEDGNEVQITSGGKILSASLDSKDEDDMASDSASHTATQQSIKKYVDDENTADHPAYSGGESHTDGSGLIIKMGEVTSGGTSIVVSFGSAFPTGIVSVVVTPEDSTVEGGETTNVVILAKSASSFTIGQATGYYPRFSWIAIGW